ncbi:MAG: hypothetical protein ACOZIN_00950 [Myxococcota bacterium]
MRTWNAKRVLAVAMGLGLAVLGVEVAMTHLAGREVVVPPQYIPVVFGPLAAVVLVAVGLAVRTEKVFLRVVGTVGAVATLVGMAGTTFHARALWRLLEEMEWTWVNVEAALGVAPPPFAPGAFAGIGLLLMLLAHRRVTVELRGPELAGKVVPFRALVALKRAA